MGIIWSFLKRVLKSVKGHHVKPTTHKESKSPDTDVDCITTPIQSPDINAPPIEPANFSNFDLERSHEETDSIEAPKTTDDHQQSVDRHPSIDPPSNCRPRFSSDISETQRSDVEDQLLSIPPEDVSEVDDNDNPPAHQDFPDPPLTFDKLIEYVIPASVLKYMDIKDIIRVRRVSRHMRQIVDDYLLHRILPKTEITFYLKYLSKHDARTEREWEHLTPVIRRVDKEKRMLPHDRVVYEPEYTGVPKHLQHRGKFEPEGIMFRLNMNDRTWKFYWPLIANAERTSRTYRDDRYREDRYRSHSIELKYTLMHQYYRFDTFKNSPVYVFYKEQREYDSVRLHAISIPIEYLRQCLFTNHGYTD